MMVSQAGWLDSSQTERALCVPTLRNRLLG